MLKIVAYSGRDTGLLAACWLENRHLNLNLRENSCEDANRIQMAHDNT
jgi:hypothetical protein